MTDSDYMRMALQLSVRALGSTSPNPVVGCVITRGKQIIAQGWHKRCGGDHAEVMALKAAKGRAKGAKMYVTLEPCHHFGRTPPCVDKIIQSGIKEIYIGARDPNPLTHGKSIHKLRKAGIKVSVGLLGEETRKVNEPFFKYIREGMPWVAAKTAQTLDGKVATSSGESKWITSQAARAYGRAIRAQFDAILVGIDTVIHDDPGLNADCPGKKMKKIIVDSALRLPARARLFSNTDRGDVIVAVTHRASRKKIEAAVNCGARVMVSPGRSQRVNLRWLFQELVKEGVTSILIEGGPKVIGSALKEKLVDKMYIYVAPKILGDREALDAVSGLRAAHLNQALTLTNTAVEILGNDVLWQGYVRY